MERVYQGVMGGFSVIREGDEKHDPTHYILTIREYNDLQKRIKDAKAAAENAEKLQHQAEDKMRDGIKEAKKNAQKEIKEEREKIKAEMQQAISDKVSAEKLNEQLLVIMKNRANAARGIKPKKQHDGYVVLRSEQYEFTHQLDRKSRESLVLWRTVIQTPIDISINIKEAEKVVNEALVNRIAARLGWEKASLRGGSLSNNIKEVDEKGWGASILLDIKFRQNTKTKLWEVTYIHNRSITIPEDMYSS